MVEPVPAEPEVDTMTSGSCDEDFSESRLLREMTDCGIDNQAFTDDQMEGEEEVDSDDSVIIHGEEPEPTLTHTDQQEQEPTATHTHTDQQEVEPTHALT